MEGNNANLYTTDAIHSSECYKVAYSINTGSLTPSVSDISGQRSLVGLLYFGPVVNVMVSHSGGRGSTPLGGYFHTAELTDEILLENVSRVPTLIQLDE